MCKSLSFHEASKYVLDKVCLMCNICKQILCSSNTILMQIKHQLRNFTYIYRRFLSEIYIIYISVIVLGDAFSVCNQTNVRPSWQLNVMGDILMPVNLLSCETFLPFVDLFCTVKKDKCFKSAKI